MSILAAPFQKRSLENPNVPITAYQLADIFGGGPTRAGVQVNERTALTFMAVYTAVKVISESIGSLPLSVYRNIDTDRSEIVRNTPESFMLEVEPNDEQTAAFYKECVQTWQCLWGNGYSRILKTGRRTQLIPLRSDRVHPERKAGSLVYRLEADGAGGVAQTFDKEEILHLPGLSLNGVSGLSPIGLAREAIATGKAAEILGATLYGNGTNVGGILQHPGKLKPETKQSIKESWNNQYQGVANSHKVAILDEGVTYAKIGMSMQDAQFIDNRKFSVVEIARLYRVPPHMLMDLDRSTNNNIEQQSLEFLQYCLRPWLTKWEQELTRKIFGVGSEFYIAFDIRKLLSADMSAQQQFFAAGRQWGWFTTNDVRRQLGLNPVAGGDVLLSPQNMVPADKAHPLVDSQIAKNLMPSKPSPAERDDGVRKMAQRLFSSVLRRLTKKEANAVRKSAEAGGDFAAWAVRFYGEHAGQLREALTEPASAIAEMAGADVSGVTAAVHAFVNSSVDACRENATKMMSQQTLRHGMDEHERAYPDRTAEILAGELMDILATRKD